MAGGDARPSRRERAQGLDVVQRWFQAVIRHPGGVRAGAREASADFGARDVDDVIRPSARLDASRRLGIYAHAYYARLLECLAQSYPVVRRALGKDLFEDFAFEYLRRYPSRSYTLSLLGERFADFLQETRPDRASGAAGEVEVAWPDFLIDLARLEWTVAEVFDGPGFEGRTTLSESDLRGMAGDDWPRTRLRPVPCLRLLRLKYPVNEYFTQARTREEDVELEVPSPRESHVAVTRREFVVWRYDLDRTEFVLLEELAGGSTVGAAIEAAANCFDGADEEFAARLQRWFQRWVAEGFFLECEVGKE